MSEFDPNKVIRTDQYTAEELLKKVYHDITYIRTKLDGMKDEHGHLESRISKLETNEVRRSAQQKTYITVGGVLLTLINVGANIIFKLV